MLRVLALGAGVCATLAACKPAPQSPPPPPRPEIQPVRIGLLLPLTGRQQAFGTEALDGARLAVERLNAKGGVLGRPIELVVRDTAGESGAAAEFVAGLAAEPALPVVLGEVVSSRTLEAARAAQSAALPMIAPSATHPGVTQAGGFVFRTCYADPAQGGAMARFALSLGARRAAILHDPGDPYSTALAAAFREGWLAAGGAITTDSPLPAGDEQLAKELGALAAAGPDVVFLPVEFRDAARVITRARELEISAPFLGGDAWDAPEFFELAGGAAENCYAASHFSAGKPSPEVEIFYRAFSEAKGRTPAALAALFYDAVHVAAAAINAAGSLNRDMVRDALARIEHPGVTGLIAFDESRNCRKPVEILRVQDGRFTYLETIEPPPR